MRYSKELKIGVFAVSVFVISFFMINYLRGEDLFNRENEYIAEYDMADGLVASAPIYIKGYKAGKVKDVTYCAEKDNFVVTGSVLREFSIPADSRMVIYGVDLMGSRGIRIDMGTSDTPASDGDTLTGVVEAAMLEGLMSGVVPLLDKVGNTLDSLSATVSAVNSLLSEGNRASVASTLAHLESTISNFSRVASAVEGRSSELEDFIDNLAILSGQFRDIAVKVDTTMTGVSSIVSALDEKDIADVISSFRLLLENINDPDGTVGRLLVDDSVYNSIDELLSDVDSLVRKIEENPKRYIKLSVF
ncbi:MAG: MCE family protein [Bacteroidales bacterium]|nr:MCE family protein [Bacteroidales bacterium]